MPGRKVARVLIVDAHPLVRRGLAELIGNESDLAVSAEVAGRSEALEAIASVRPDLVIVDRLLGLGRRSDGSDAVGLVRGIRLVDENLPVLVLTIDDEPQWARRAFEAGANGFVSKQEIGKTLLAAIRAVLGGERFLTPSMSAELGLGESPMR